MFAPSQTARALVPWHMSPVGPLRRQPVRCDDGNDLNRPCIWDRASSRFQPCASQWLGVVRSVDSGTLVQCRCHPSPDLKSTSNQIATIAPINKVPVACMMTAQLYQYLLTHTREPQVLRDLRDETSRRHGAHMQITPEQGQFLALLVELLGVRRAVEVGVFTGYSSLAVALALPSDGRLVALDKDESSMAVAREYWEAAGIRHKVLDRVGPAAGSLQRLLDEEGPETYDFAFIDADKRKYWDYFELLLQLVRPGGLIAVDNVLFYGKVADNKVTDKATVALREFNARMLNDERVTLSIVPVGDGIALCRKR